MLETYFTRLQTVLDRYAATPFVLLVNSNSETRPGGQGYLSGSVTFQDGSMLYFSEFLDSTPNTVDRLMYSYHYQSARDELILRYDNARHRPPVASIHHKHTPGEILPTPAPSLEDVLAEIVSLKGWL